MITQVQAFITEIGSWLGPILLAILTGYYSVKEIWDFFKNRHNRKKEDTTINLLTQIVTDSKSKAATKTKELMETVDTRVGSVYNALQTECNTIKKQATTLGEMLSLIFENSTLAPDVKERLRLLKTKLDCPSESGVIEELLSQNETLKDKLDHTIQELEDIKSNDTAKIVKDVEADTTSTRLTSQTIIQ